MNLFLAVVAWAACVCAIGLAVVAWLEFGEFREESDGDGDV